MSNSVATTTSDVNDNRKDKTKTDDTSNDFLALKHSELLFEDNSVVLVQPPGFPRWPSLVFSSWESAISCGFEDFSSQCNPVIPGKTAVCVFLNDFLSNVYPYSKISCFRHDIDLNKIAKSHQKGYRIAMKLALKLLQCPTKLKEERLQIIKKRKKDMVKNSSSNSTNNNGNNITNAKKQKSLPPPPLSHCDGLAPTPLNMELWQRKDVDPSPRVWDESFFEDATSYHTPTVDDDAVAVKRSGRSRATVKKPTAANIHTMHAHTLVECGREVKQPYNVRIHPEAAFVCDLHAHVASIEIIGYLGGKWDANSSTLYIQASFPCRGDQSAEYDGSTDVEMDFQSELEVREIIEKQGLEVVGWYHSHPEFPPNPSIRDIENQQECEARFKSVHPFIGLIVGTYDTNNKNADSIFRYFHVAGSTSPYELDAMPRQLRERALKDDSELPPTNTTNSNDDIQKPTDDWLAENTSVTRLAKQCVSVIDYYSRFQGKVDFKEQWKGKSKLHKVEQSLTRWSTFLPCISSDFIKGLVSHARKKWEEEC